MELKAREYRVSGRVQGVGFRYHTAYRAYSLGVTGFAHNLPDKTVKIYAEGAGDQLKAFHDFLVAEPGLSRIDQLEFNETRIASRVYHNFSTG